MHQPGIAKRREGPSTAMGIEMRERNSPETREEKGG